MSEGPVTETSLAASVDQGSRVPPDRERTRIGRYHVEGVIGRGGMGVVYLGRDPGLDRSVAIKLLGDELPASRLIREGQVLAQISHPNVIHVYEVGREGPGLVYIAMEHVAGVTLATWLETARTHAEITRVFVDAGRGLAAAHAAGIVHRDFKPENVMIDRAGRARVLDFGLATTAEEFVALAPDVVVGTPSYMSPEQWRGEHPGAASDQFSFCVALAHALTGTPPFGRGSRAELRAAVLEGTPSLGQVPRRLRATLKRGLALDPAARFPTMSALVAALETRRPAPWLGVGAMGIAALTAFTFKSSPTTRAYAAPIALTTRGDVLAAAVSPDSTQLAVLTPTALMLYDTSLATEPRVILRGRFANHTLAWDPAGARLAVVVAPERSDTQGLVIVDPVHGGRRIADNLGMTVLLDAPGGARDELAAVRYAGTEVRFYDVAAPTTPLRTCPLPKPFSGVRAIRAAERGVLVTLDRGDSEAGLVRIDRDCSTEIVAEPVRALDFLAAGKRVFARSLGTNDLIELTTSNRLVLQSADYQPLAIDDTDRVTHLDRAMRWSFSLVDGTPREIAGGTGESRFAMTFDGTTLAHVDSIHQHGALRVRTFDQQLAERGDLVTTNVARVAWSPDDRRLAVLAHETTGYTVAIWDRVSKILSPPRRIKLPYDSEMTWIDDRRVAFGVAHEYRGFAWIDPMTGETGKLVYGDQPTMSLARAHRSHRLAFITETATEIIPWLVEDTGPRRLASIAVTSPRSSRLARLVWNAGDDSVLVFDGATGENWSVAIADGRIERRPDLPMSRAGASGELAIAATQRGLAVFGLTVAADVYRSAPL